MVLQEPVLTYDELQAFFRERYGIPPNRFKIKLQQSIREGLIEDLGGGRYDIEDWIVERARQLLAETGDPECLSESWTPPEKDH